MDNDKLAKLKEACDDYIRYLASDESHEDADDDWENDIFEKALEAMRGDSVWDEIQGLRDARDERSGSL